MELPLVIYGGDSDKDRTGLGLKSILRSNTGLKKIYDHPHDRFTIYLAAGTHPAHPHKPALKDMYKEYLEDQVSAMKHDAIWDGLYYTIPMRTVKENGWGTSEETELIIHEFPELLNQKIFVVSSASHKSRIETAWRLFANKEVTVIPCDHPEKASNSILEFVKTLECYVFAYTYRIFGRKAYLMLSGMKNKVIALLDVHW